MVVTEPISWQYEKAQTTNGGLGFLLDKAWRMRGAMFAWGYRNYVVTDTETSVIVRSAASVEPDTTLTYCAPANTAGSSAMYRLAATVTLYCVPSL